MDSSPSEPHRSPNDRLLKVMDEGREMLHDLKTTVLKRNPMREVDNAREYFQKVADLLKNVAQEEQARDAVPPGLREAQTRFVESIGSAAQGVDKALTELGVMKKHLEVQAAENQAAKMKLTASFAEVAPLIHGRGFIDRLRHGGEDRLDKLMKNERNIVAQGLAYDAYERKSPLTHEEVGQWMKKVNHMSEKERNDECRRLKGLAEKGPAMWDVHSRADEIQKIIRGDSAKVGDTPSLLSDLAAIRKQGREMDKQSNLGAEVERKPPPLSLVVEIQDGKAIAKRDAAQQRSPGFPIDAEQVNRLGLKHGDKVLAAFDASKQINIVQKVANDNHHTQQQAHGLTRH